MNNLNIAPKQTVSFLSRGFTVCGYGTRLSYRRYQYAIACYKYWGEWEQVKHLTLLAFHSKVIKDGVI